MFFNLNYKLEAHSTQKQKQENSPICNKCTKVGGFLMVTKNFGFGSKKLIRVIWFLFGFHKKKWNMESGFGSGSSK
jgi:hypothetical protein